MRTPPAPKGDKAMLDDLMQQCGRKWSIPLKADRMSSVCGHGTPVRARKMSNSEFESPGRNIVESDTKAMNRPSAEMDG